MHSNLKSKATKFKTIRIKKNQIRKNIFDTANLHYTLHYTSNSARREFNVYTRIFDDFTRFACTHRTSFQ